MTWGFFLNISFKRYYIDNLNIDKQKKWLLKIAKERSIEYNFAISILQDIAITNDIAITILRIKVCLVRSKTRIYQVYHFAIYSHGLIMWNDEKCMCG